MITRVALLVALALPMGCAVQNRPALASVAGSPSAQQIEVAFSPEAGAEALVLKVLGSAKQSLRLAGYSFTSPAVVRGLIDAKRRGIDVRVVLDDKGNRSQASISAMNLLLGAGIPLRVVSAYSIHHDK
jgi:phosphatidylserine/phosphatidylglycerophosphate/cardiolipin synthase-like enzyme